VADLGTDAAGLQNFIGEASSFRSQFQLWFYDYDTGGTAAIALSLLPSDLDHPMASVDRSLFQTSDSMSDDPVLQWCAGTSVSFELAKIHYTQKKSKENFVSI